MGLTLLTLAVYSQVYRHGFIDFDDTVYVLQNRHVNQGLTWSGIVWAFTTGYATNWHPLTWLSHMLDCRLFGLAAGPQHLVSVLFHIVGTLLLFLVLRDLTGALWKSASVAALFALHPLHVESVAWIAERKDVLSTMFWMLTLWTYLRYVRKPGALRYSACLLCFALGLMAKPMLVTLPFVLLLIDFWPLGRFSAPAGAKTGKKKQAPEPVPNRWLHPVLALIREKAPFFILAAASSIVTYLVQASGGAVKSATVFPFATRVANALHAYAGYLVNAAWPSGLTFFYRYPFGGYPIWRTALAALLLIGITVLAFRFAGRFPYFTVGWLWYLGTLVPVIGLVQAGWQAMADRYTYIPLIGIFVIVVWGAAEVAAAIPGGRKILIAAGAAALMAFSTATWFQLRWWRDSATLFSRALALDRENYMAHGLLGNSLAMQHKYPEAIAHYSEALRLKPDEVDFIGNLGSALYRMGKTEEAIEQYSRALAIDPNEPYALKNLGLALYDRGEFAEALARFEKARAKTPEDLTLLCARANALARTGKYQESIGSYRQVLSKEPENTEALFGLGLVLGHLGDDAGALQALEKSLQINPGYAEAHNSLANIRFKQGRMDQAISHYQQAVRLKPQNPEMRYNLGIALYSQGKDEEAIANYREAIRLRPQYAEAYLGLAAALERQGDERQALANCAEAVRRKPDFGEAYDRLGVMLFNSGQAQKALEAFSEALRLNPNDAETRHHRDQVLTALGRTKRHP